MLATTTTSTDRDGLLARDLERSLRRRISGEVRFDGASRALYASDLSVYRQVPIGVVVPRGLDDVVETVAACRERGVPILARGCGTSLAGQTCNAAVVIDFSKYLHHIVELDARRRFAVVEPGVINDRLREAAEEHHLTFAPDPATHAWCTLGGMIGNNSCGAHSVMGGKTVENVEELDVLLYDGTRLTVGATSDRQLAKLRAGGGRTGEIFDRLAKLRDRYGDEVRTRYPKIPRRVSGYNLDQLLPENGFHVARALVGSESTLALVLRAKVRLVPSPPFRALLALGFPELANSADVVPRLLELGPLAVEGFERHVIENLEHKGKSTEGAKLLPEGTAWTLVEFGGKSAREADGRARQALDALTREIACTGARIISDRNEQQHVWKLRESGVGSSYVPEEEEAYASWEDAAVAPEKLGDYLRAYKALLGRYQLAATTYGHWGQGCVHSRIAFDLKTSGGVAQFRRFMEDAAELVVAFGGSLSGEHGDGQARGELLPRMFGPEIIQAFREMKSIWDPHWRMNPGKVIDAYPLDSNLRLGPDYRPRQVQTHFQFPDDAGSMSHATERCFGVGKCRDPKEGTMCPSFEVTREERHTTRGRARLLFEMLRGDAISDGWRDPGVKEALDLCLSCKGCKHDCPVSVDVATYKSEFLSHYWDGRVRPRSAYSMGLIHRWARVASRAPAVANFFGQTPGISHLARLAAGVSVRRKLPRFAKQPFTASFRARERRTGAATSVLLWPDTFNNYFLPHTAHAAVDVLESCGYEVTIPEGPLCCGRPLYDFGMLEKAKHQLREILDALQPQLRAGTPIVVLEPSCASVFRDELRGLFPTDEDARRLSKQTVLLSELLHRDRDSLPKLHRKLTVHGHCHHKSVLGFDPEHELLDSIGADAQVLESGCCGMAGSFGFEPEKVDVSLAIGERRLLPAVRAAPNDELLVANGFSCREQIAQTTKRRALHVAELLAMARQTGPSGPEGKFPERAYIDPAQLPRSGAKKAALALGAAIAMGTALFAARRNLLPA